MQILLLNGPNLNMLGKREPEVYGSTTLADIENDLVLKAKSMSVSVEAFQANSEHALIDKIHASAVNGVNAIIFNPAAFTHTSVALRDALLSVNIPFIEVHLSNVHKREAFRHHSYFSDIALGTIVGLGAIGYQFALDALVKHIQKNSN